MNLIDLDQSQLLEPDSPLRITIDEQGLDELAESIDQVGLLQPLVVRRLGDKYEVIAGHRRLLATRKLGWPKVRCVVVDDESDDEALAARLHENVVRRDISPVEEAAFYAELFEKLLDIDKVAKLVKRSRGVVEDRLAPLAGDRTVMDALAQGKISMAAAQELNRVKDEGIRSYLLEYAIKEGATAEKIRNWRWQYQDISIQHVDTSKPPEVQPQTDAVQTESPACYLCGGTDDLHEMVWVPMHASCRKYVERQAASTQEVSENPEGH